MKEALSGESWIMLFYLEYPGNGDIKKKQLLSFYWRLGSNIGL